MKRKTIWGAVVVLLLVAVGAGASRLLVPQPATAFVTQPASTVLYTVHQGPPITAVESYHKLVQLRDDQGLESAGDTGTFVYLNGRGINPDDQLIEVRIPVTSTAVSARDSISATARNYELGTTNVKQIPARTAVTATKAKGVSDPTSIFNSLYRTIDSNGLAASDSPSETFSSVSAIPATCAYDELETQVAIPVASKAAVVQPADPTREKRQ